MDIQSLSTNDLIRAWQKKSNKDFHTAIRAKLINDLSYLSSHLKGKGCTVEEFVDKQLAVKL